jgi:hypothetical protein
MAVEDIAKASDIDPARQALRMSRLAAGGVQGLALYLLGRPTTPFGWLPC